MPHGGDRRTCAIWRHYNASTMRSPGGVRQFPTAPSIKKRSPLQKATLTVAGLSRLSLTKSTYENQNKDRNLLSILYLFCPFRGGGEARICTSWTRYVQQLCLLRIAQPELNRGGLRPSCFYGPQLTKGGAHQEHHGADSGSRTHSLGLGRTALYPDELYLHMSPQRQEFHRTGAFASLSMGIRLM